MNTYFKGFNHYRQYNAIYIYLFVEYGNGLHAIWAHQAFKTGSSNWVLNHLRSISISKMQNMREEREKE